MPSEKVSEVDQELVDRLRQLADVVDGRTKHGGKEQGLYDLEGLIDSVAGITHPLLQYTWKLIPDEEANVEAEKGAYCFRSVVGGRWCTIWRRGTRDYQTYPTYERRWVLDMRDLSRENAEEPPSGLSFDTVRAAQAYCEPFARRCVNYLTTLGKFPVRVVTPLDNEGDALVDVLEGERVVDAHVIYGYRGPLGEGDSGFISFQLDDSGVNGCWVLTED